MDELISIIQQRRSEINATISTTQQKHKSQLIQHQRKRIQRQNWILRVIKTIKIPVIQQKKYIFRHLRIIVQTIIKVMNFFKPIEPPSENIENVNFTQTVINLFVEFYNKFQHMDLTHIRTIIRPNNNFIIVDLIKSLIELSRKQFKAFIQQHFKAVVSKNKLELKAILLKNEAKAQEIRPNLRAKIKTQAKSSKASIERDGQSNYQHQTDSKIYKLIETCLFQKYGRAIDNFNIEVAYQRFNALYFDLLYLNQKNAHRIQKYMDSCFGAKRHINYDATGLYTIQEIKSIKKERQERATNRMADLKDLNQKCPIQHLKEYFKMKVQLHQSIHSLPSFKNGQTIRSWFPIVCIKNGDKLHPFNMMVEINGNTYFQAEFEEKYNKKLKSFMKEQLSGQFSNKSLFSCEDAEMLTFNRKSFLDYNNSKIIELVTKEIPKVYKWENQNQRQKSKQKQRMFPPIGSVYNGDLSTQNRSMKSKSQSRLPNASMVMYSKKNGEGLKQILEKRLNYSSFVQDMEVSSRKINSIIGNILKSKQHQLK